MKILKNTKTKGVYNAGDYTLSEKQPYIMVYSEKPDKWYNAEIKLIGWCDWNSGYDFYLNNNCSVQITVCGKKQRAVRPDKIYLFETIEEYKNWFNKNNKTNNKMSDKLFCDALFDALGFHRIDGGDNFWDSLEKSGFWDKNRTKEKEKTDFEDPNAKVGISGSISFHIQNENHEQDIWVSQKNDKYFIDGVAVDKNTYDNAVKVICGNGTAEKIVNSVKDILSEYQETKEKELKQKQDTEKREQLEKKIAELQAELEQLKK